MGEPQTSSKKRNLKRAFAIGASVLLHIAVFMGMAISSSSSLSKYETKGDGQADLEGFQISLVDLHTTAKAPPSLSAPQQSSPQDKAMQAMQQMANHAPSQPVKPSDYSVAKSPPRTLAQVFGANPFQPASAEPPSVAAKTQKAAHVQVNQNNSPTMNDLWKAIEPCWRRLADKNTESVTLQISFSPLGNLAKPPTILRAPGAHLDDRLLRSENQAITALAQCGPYLMAYGQQDVKVQFPAPD